MPYLVFVTLLWAFSFSLIGVYLAGAVDSYFSVLTRIALAALLFAPLLRWRQPPRLAAGLMLCGALQLGIMYLFYYQSFLLLTVPEVLIFTVLTPVYVTLVYDLLHRRFNPGYLFTAVLAVLGALVIRFDALTDDYLLGFAVVQGANLCFALGQVGYKVLLERYPSTEPQHKRFGYFYLGALLVVTPAWLGLGGEQYPATPLQWGILLWLGLGASGLGYFLWNKGATLVNAGALAIMNNALVPAGLLVNLLIWNRDADLPRLALGGAILLASLWLNEAWIKVSRPAPSE
ncbi:drug/metabolite transporter superfamily permease [Oceanimonas sp. GK1]|uniref:carboxylate/amino acid/amine transporter n=1 Tax=Oceanimonas sp. (strain GK1 / IBRC-M 10197) TaxID=511062 RepID=UPI0002494B56|nr:carboxylate/amino acid/amine transporter [Oceanimonas sp. GK1]AEY00347.1 drug/metabolite transporter superfamily permease [Oceanimonas sp. GK1]